MVHAHHNLLGEPPATLLPGNREAAAELAAGTPPAEVAANHPTASAAWAALAEEALHRPDRLPPRPGRAAAQRLEGLRPGPVVARAQPRLPALRDGPGEGRGGDRRDRGAGASHQTPARLRPLAGPLTAFGAESGRGLGASSGTLRSDLWVLPVTPTVPDGGATSLTRRSR